MIQLIKSKQWILALVGLASIPVVVTLLSINPFSKKDSGFLYVLDDSLAIVAIIHITAIIILLVIIVRIKVKKFNDKLPIPLKIGLLYYITITIIASNEPGFHMIYYDIIGLFKN